MTRIALAALATMALTAGPQAAAKRPVTIDDSVSLRGVGALYGAMMRSFGKYDR